jgi:hypothetical protein
MPTIKRFGNVSVVMYGADHNPPHVHIIGPDFAAQVSFEGEIINGSFPGKKRRVIIAWILSNQTALVEMWNRLTRLG